MITNNYIIPNVTEHSSRGEKTYDVDHDKENLE